MRHEVTGTLLNMSLVVRKPVFGFPTRSHTNQAVHLQKMVRGLKFRIKEVEGLYYLFSENKGTDQLRGYREADLRLCFRICIKPVFSQRGSYFSQYFYKKHLCLNFCILGLLL